MFRNSPVPPPGFGYPPGGFVPSIPGRFCFAPAALLGFALRSLTPVRLPLVTERLDPLTVSPVVLPIAEAFGRPDRLRFLGFAPDQSFPRWHVGLAQPPEDTPMGFSLPGFFAKALARLSPNLLSRASPQHPQMLPLAPQSLDRPLLRSSTSSPAFGQARHLREALSDEQPS